MRRALQALACPADKVRADDARDAPARIALVACAALAVLTGLAQRRIGEDRGTGDREHQRAARGERHSPGRQRSRAQHRVPAARALHAAQRRVGPRRRARRTPSNPGYTVRGAGAAKRSVLAATGWFAPNPWATAPGHLAQVLNPALRRTGYGQESTYICLDTVAGRQPQAADLLTYPGPNTTNIPPALTAAEITPDGTLYHARRQRRTAAPARGPGRTSSCAGGPARVGRRRLADRTAGPVPIVVSANFVIPARRSPPARPTPRA